MSSSEKGGGSRIIPPTPGGPDPPSMTDKGTSQAPGEGIRSLRTSAAFRALNFELYAKPNKKVMGFGIAGLVIAVGYLFYINYALYDRNQFYYATNEDDTRTARPKTSRWES